MDGGHLTSFLSSSSSSDDDELFGLIGGGGFGGFGAPVPRRRGPPRKIQGKETWLLGERIGSGASSVVKAGIDVKSLKIAAVKVVDMRRLRRTRGAIERVQTEIRVLRALQHENVVSLMDVVEEKERQRMYLIMEMVNGSSLQDLIQKEGDGMPGTGRALPPSQVSFLIGQALTALQYVHGRGFVHRDVKPANLMITSTGLLKLTDFGVVEELDKYKAEDKVSKTLGSPAFQAPEIARGAEEYSGTKVDVWALGVTIYYLLTGNVPFISESHIGLFKAIEKGEYSYPTNVAVPDDAKDLIDKMLRVNFHERISIDECLKHPWILQGKKSIPKQRQIELGWIQVAPRTFNVLELANRYMENESNNVTSASDTTNNDINFPTSTNATMQTTGGGLNDIQSLFRPFDG